MAVNVDAAWWLCRAVWPLMRSRGYGRIVLTTSDYLAWAARTSSFS